MAGSAFDIEQARLAASRRLPVNCHDDFLRLSRTLVHGPAFQWLLVDAPDEVLRRQVMQELKTVLHTAGLRSNQLPLSGHIADVAALEARLVKNAQSADVIHVVGRPGWFDVGRWDAFNARRERLSAEVNARLVFWLDEDAIALASGSAPDLWAWRGGVYAFLPEVSPLTQPAEFPSAHSSGSPKEFLSPGPAGEDRRTMAERSRRVAEIRTWLRNNPRAPDDLLAAALNELGGLLHDLGDHDESLFHLQHVELPFHERRGDALAVAVTKGRIADVLQTRGQLDEALRIRQQDQLPIYERLGDLRAKAVTMGRIADILQARGQLDEALRVYQQELVPVFERLGEVRDRAVAMGRIADILQARGQFDEALRIRREEELPVYQRLGSAHAEAVAKGRVADILQARGQFDEALRIRQENQLPVYERLGDVRARAVTMGKIADILQARGQVDEALRIRRQDQLPVFERLGDVREKAITLNRIANSLIVRGQIDEALHIHQHEELPIYAQLGDERGIAIARWVIGAQLLGRGEQWAKAARSMLVSAWRTLSEMDLPEAEELAALLRSRSIPLDDRIN